MKKLIIVESPSKAKTIAKYLGNEVTVVASKGHICDLPTRTLGIDIKQDFKPQYIVSEDKKKLIASIKNTMSKCDEVYLATDPDREGEAIAMHLMNQLNIDSDKKVRIVFNEISKKAVQNAILEPREIDKNLVDAQQARRVLDRLVGYKISPVVSRAVQSAKSAGRVQSPALKMIVDREIEIENFVPKEYWTISVYLKNNASQQVKALFNDISGKKIKVESKEVADAIIKDLNVASYIVDDVKRSVLIAKPAPPFTTSTMQQDANNKLGMTSEIVMSTAQKLYEGVDIEGLGLHALITYMRTDSVRVSPDFQKKTREYIVENFGAEFVPHEINEYKKSANAQDAHEAIRPITLEIRPQDIYNKVDNRIYRLYKLIYERYMASQMSNAEYDTLTVHINADKGSANNDSDINDNPYNKVGFVLKGKTIKFKGYTAIYTNTNESDEEDETLNTTPDFNVNEILNYIKYEAEQKFTKPPKRYTDASLVKAMEENGIGRPSTYASIISVLISRGYITREKRIIYPTVLGRATTKYLEKAFVDLMDLKFTAHFEVLLDKIAEGEKGWVQVIREYYDNMVKTIDSALNNMGERISTVEVSDVICEKCGAHMLIRTGRFGKFLACQNYPQCKNTKPILDTVGKCPKCGGNIYKRMSKKGKAFFICENNNQTNKTCDLITWKIPADHLCPECGSVMEMLKKDNEIRNKCTSCGHIEVIKLNDENN